VGSNQFGVLRILPVPRKAVNSADPPHVILPQLHCLNRRGMEVGWEARQKGAGQLYYVPAMLNGSRRERPISWKGTCSRKPIPVLEHNDVANHSGVGWKCGRHGVSLVHRGLQREFCWLWGRGYAPLIMICKMGECASVRSDTVGLTFFILLSSPSSTSTDATSRMC